MPTFRSLRRLPGDSPDCKFGGRESDKSSFWISARIEFVLLPSALTFVVVFHYSSLMGDDNTTPHPHSFRLSDEDQEMLAYLRERLGMKSSPVLRLALRRLYQAEKKQDK
ncbi:hypothetical protein SAMN05443244_2344 [Terriglobus roseus]|uniref:Ribbon-helix-helix protein, copG family n=1 Tax=Terriglobus roseus TaxID=392734 RepID=A0A1H4NSP8_9BACT|nr:hypothetical protein SAMN05443244_2344 [Terriglobus roseus]